MPQFSPSPICLDRPQPPPADWASALRRHERWLRTVVVSRLGEPSAVDDVMQEIACAAMKVDRSPADIPEDRTAPWLYRVAVRQCLLYRRKAGRQRRLLRRYAAAPRGPEPENDPLIWLLGCERESAVHAALRRLVDVDRQILLLKHTEDWTYAQLAEHLGVSINVIEYRLLKARNRLRELLIGLQAVEAHL